MKLLLQYKKSDFQRIKHDSSFPFKSIEYVLKAANVNLSDLDNIIFYEKPFLKFERLIETHIAFAPHGFKSFLCIYSDMASGKTISKEIDI